MNISSLLLNRSLVVDVKGTFFGKRDEGKFIDFLKYSKILKVSSALHGNESAKS